MSEATLAAALAEATAKLKEQDELLAQITASSVSYATVVDVGTRTEMVKTYPPTLAKGVKVMAKQGWAKAGETGTVTSKDAYGSWNVRFPDVGTIGGYDERGLTILPVETPTTYGYCLAASGTTILELRYDKPVERGDTVRINALTGGILDVTPWRPAGGIATVSAVFPNTIEVEYGGDTLVVYGSDVVKGDRVVLDSSRSVIVRNLGKADDRFAYDTATTISWDDIGGLESVKAQMREVIELPRTQPDLYAFYGKKPVKGVLLYGPPGCGKTMLGKATATAIAQGFAKGKTSRSLSVRTDTSGGFLYVKGPEILDKFVGVAEATIRRLFEAARRHKAEKGHPAVVFIDEADAILGRRGMGVSSDLERTIVPTFLTEMDGLDDSGAIVLLATNRPDVLDPAVVRDGRIDRKIKVDRPTQTMAADIFSLYLGKVPFHNGNSVAEMADLAASALYDPGRALKIITLKDHSVLTLTLANVTNGGMIASIVDQATSIALRRDIKAKTRSGLRPEDLATAVENVYVQNLDLDHRDELADILDGLTDHVASVRKARINRPVETSHAPEVRTA